MKWLLVKLLIRSDEFVKSLMTLEEMVSYISANNCGFFLLTGPEF